MRRLLSLLIAAAMKIRDQVDVIVLAQGSMAYVEKDIEAAWRDAKACGYEIADTAINFLPFFENGVKFFTIIGPNREKVEFNQYL